MGAAFTYGQFFLALGAAFLVTPQVLGIIGSRDYGLWLSSGELLGYFLLLDFGVFAVLPWLIAQAEGQQDPAGIKRLLSQGLAVACVLLLLLFGVVGASWHFAPGFLHLSPGEWRQLAPPLAVLVVLLGVNLPLNIFTPLLTGLQDVKFLGCMGLLKVVVAPALTLGLLFTGHGLYALALGTALFSPLVGGAAFFRVRHLAPELLRDWPRPSWQATMRLFRESSGAWLGSAGVQLMERSSAVVLTLLGNPAIVPVLVCTSRIGQTLTQMAWVMPDSALIGLAQLSAEDKPERLREVTLSIIRLNLVLAGLMACVVLAINPAFVRIWVGDRYFGGLLLNLLLAVEVLTASLNHALATVVAVQGHRFSIGVATLVQGAIYLVLALGLTRRYSLEGLLVADLVAPFCSMVPVSLWLLQRNYGLRLKQITVDLGTLVSVRILPCLLFAGAYGRWRGGAASLPELVAAGVCLSFGYLRVMGPQLDTFPLPTRVRTFLQRAHLV